MRRYDQIRHEKIGHTNVKKHKNDISAGDTSMYDAIAHDHLGHEQRRQGNTNQLTGEPHILYMTV